MLLYHTNASCIIDANPVGPGGDGRRRPMCLMVIHVLPNSQQRRKFQKRSHSHSSMHYCTTYIVPPMYANIHVFMTKRLLHSRHLQYLLLLLHQSIFWFSEYSRLLT